MDLHAAVIGGSIGGLAAGIGLARRGWRVTVVERDGAPETDSGDDAFVSWERRHVPQFRQPHGFSARSRNLLLAYVPEVVDWLHADGVAEVNLFKLLAPPERWSDGDDAYTGFWTRRPGFELGIRRVAEQEPGLRILSPCVVDGLVCSETADGAVLVTGLRLADGSILDADLVIDAAGRRTPVPDWLGEVGVDLSADVQDCGAVYFSRYYRRRAESDLPLIAVVGLRDATDGLNAIGFPGDHDTFGIAVFVPPSDEQLTVLRHDWAWDAVTAALPNAAPWTSPDNSTPLTGVQFMGGHQNLRRHWVRDGRPLALGVLPVGDSLCTTNPMYGWGASMALTYAFAAVEAATEHPDDPVAAALAYDAAVRDEADGVYRESAAMDRVRTYQWRGDEVPESDRDEAERQELIACVAAGALRDPVLGRAFLRRAHLLEPPGAVLDDPEVVEHARNTQRILAAKTERGPTGPSRADLLAALAAAAQS